MNRTAKAVTEGFLLATIITGLLLLAQAALTPNPINIYETLAVYFSFWCTWLCTRQVRFNYILAVFSTALLSFTFWQAQLYGSMALNLYLIPTVIYGWFIWGKDTTTKPVEHVKLPMLSVYLLFTGLTWLGAYLIITRFGGQMVALDGWLLVDTVLAQYLLDRKKIETWLIWMLVNIVSVYVYFESGLYLLAAQFAFFLLNAVYAWFQWKKTIVVTPDKRPLAPQGALA